DRSSRSGVERPAEAAGAALIVDHGGADRVLPGADSGGRRAAPRRLAALLERNAERRAVELETDGRDDRIAAAAGFDDLWPWLYVGARRGAGQQNPRRMAACRGGRRQCAGSRRRGGEIRSSN